MPDPGPMALYRLRDHIPGVNWRPTRFAEAVPNLRICGLCHMIPKKTVALPCAHFLCESCHRASAADGGGVCPLDGEAFAESEGSWIPFYDRKAKDLKAHCWNQPHGCEFVGTMDVVLRHYESECAFHTVECQQCGVPVLHNELVTHYMAGCRGGIPIPIADVGDTVTLSDMRAAVEELKAFAKDPHHDQLPALQSQLNQLMEQSRQDATCLMDIMCSLTRSTEELKVNVARIASTSKKIVGQGASGEEDRVGVSGARSRGPSLTWRAEKMLILRRLEMLTEHSLNALEQLRQSVQPAGRPRIPFPFIFQSVNDTEHIPDPNDVTLEFKLNSNELLNIFDQSRPEDSVLQMIWNRRDRCLRVICYRAFGAHDRELRVGLRWCCLLQSTPLPSGTHSLIVLHKDSEKNFIMDSLPIVLQLRLGYPAIFSSTKTDLLKDEGFLTNGEMRFRLVVSNQ